MMRVPPQDVQAEQAVLGSIMQSEEALTRILPIVKEEDFYKKAHREIFGAILKLRAKGEAVDLVTVHSMLAENKLLKEIGGSVYLASLVDGVFTIANVEHYARKVQEMALRRRLIEGAGEVANLAYSKDTTISEIVQDAERKLFGILMEDQRSGFSNPIQLAQAMWDADFGEGLNPGIPALHKLTSGFHKKDFIVVAGRPGTGKSAFLHNLILRWSYPNKMPVLLFSLEMSKEQVGLRAMSMVSGLDNFTLKRLKWEGDKRYDSAVGELMKFNQLIDDNSDLHIEELRSRARKAKLESGVVAIMVDYLGLVGGDRRESRNEEVASISRGLKAMAKELNIPVIAAHQLSRNIEKRQSERPRLSDLRDSGSIEQDADMVIFLYPRQGDENGVNIFIAKQRNGPVGTIMNVIFDRKRMLFYELEKRREDE